MTADQPPIVTVKSLAGMSRREIAEWITAIGGNVYALAARVREVEAERDCMYDNGHAAALAVARIRHLIERWEATQQQNLAALAEGSMLADVPGPAEFRAALDGGDPA